MSFPNNGRIVITSYNPDGPGEETTYYTTSGSHTSLNGPYNYTNMIQLFNISQTVYFNTNNPDWSLYEHTETSFSYPLNSLYPLTWHT